MQAPAPAPQRMDGAPRRRLSLGGGLRPHGLDLRWNSPPVHTPTNDEILNSKIISVLSANYLKIVNRRNSQIICKKLLNSKNSVFKHNSMN